MKGDSMKTTPDRPLFSQDKRTANQIIRDELHSFVCDRENDNKDFTTIAQVEEFLKYLKTQYKIQVRFTK